MLRLGREREVLKVVDDQIGAPTSSRALAAATRAMADAIFAEDGEDRTGTYHASCAGAVSWAEFARAIFSAAPQEAGRPWATVEPVTSADYPTSAKRPLYSVLSNSKLQNRFGIRLPPWESELQEVMAACF